MATETIAHPAHQSTEQIRCANALFTERIDEFRYEGGVWYVPSATVEGRAYAVTLKPVERWCECRSYEFHGGPCKHILSVRYLKARTTVCSCCGGRVLWWFVSEVMEEHELLAWFPGDRICADCIHDGYWV